MLPLYTALVLVLMFVNVHGGFFLSSSQMLRSLFLLTLTATMKTEEHGVFFKIEENSFLHDGDSIWDGEADSLLSCSQLCARNAACKSANFMADHGACSLLRQRQTRHAEKRSHRQGSFYLEKVRFHFVIGLLNHIK